MDKYYFYRFPEQKRNYFKIKNDDYLRMKTERQTTLILYFSYSESVVIGTGRYTQPSIYRYKYKEFSSRSEDLNFCNEFTLKLATGPF